MSYLIAENISLSRGEKTLLDKVNLVMNQGDKIALVARNGSGKSTFLRILAGDEKSEGQHQLKFHPSARLEFLRQEPEFDPKAKIYDAALTPGYAPHDELREVQRTDPSAILSPELARTDAKVKELLFKMGLTRLYDSTAVLSGGEKKRLGLAKVFATEPDFIIMDEPTNHLDLDMIEWLEQRLQHPGLTLLLVTHDRYFLDHVCNGIVELEHGEFIKYSGNYTDYLEKRAIRQDTQRSEKSKIEKLLKKELQWIRRSPKARTTKSKSRVDKFYDTKESIEGPTDPGVLQMEIDMHRLGSKILECHNVSKSLGGKLLFDQFDYKFKRGEKVGIVGANGAGKTTLVRVMTGALRPDHGKIVIGDTVVWGHYTQMGMQLEQDMRVIDVVRAVAEYIPLKKGKKLSAESLLERFLFERPQQQVYVSQLSGGERRRLYLLQILMSNPNFLILDEPTNDLDIITLNILEEYLEDYEGCAIIISHDRYFMDKIVDHLFILQGDGKVKDYNGKYTDYRLEQSAISSSTASVPSKDSDAKIDHQREKELKNKIRKLEREIESLEEKKSSLETQLMDAQLDPDRIAELSRAFSEVGDQLAEAEDQWMELVD